MGFVIPHQTNAGFKKNSDIRRGMIKREAN